MTSEWVWRPGLSHEGDALRQHNLGRSHREIAKSLNVSRVRVSQILFWMKRGRRMMGIGG